MSAWIKLDTDLTGSIRFRRVLRTFKERCNAVVTDRNGDSCYETLLLGAVMRLWLYADSHIADDDTLDATFDEIDELVGLPGFAASLPDQWLRKIDDQRVQLPDFIEHNGSSASERRRNAKRQAEFRARQRVTPLSRTVTRSNVLEERRGEKKRTKNTLAESGGAATFEAEFAKLQATYPKRAGDQNWTRARQHINARLKEGHTWADIHAGAERYAAYIRALGKERTEYVKQAASFVGTGKGFTEAWEQPAPSAPSQRRLTKFEQATSQLQLDAEESA